MTAPDHTSMLFENQLARTGVSIHDPSGGGKGWSSRDKFAAVLETAALNEADVVEYCRKLVTGRPALRARVSVRHKLPHAPGLGTSLVQRPCFLRQLPNAHVVRRQHPLQH